MATPVDAQTVIAIVTVAASAGAAWAGVRAGLNGMRDNVKDTREHVRTVATEVQKQVDALNRHVEADHAVQVEAAKTSARIEQKVDGLVEERDALHRKLDTLLER